MRSTSVITLRAARCVSSPAMFSVMRRTATPCQLSSRPRSLTAPSSESGAETAPTPSSRGSGYSQKLCRQRWQNCSAWSVQVRMFVGAAAYSTASRTVSAPTRSSRASGSTTLPRCLLIFLPSRWTISCISTLWCGSPSFRSGRKSTPPSTFAVLRWADIVAARLRGQALVEHRAAAVRPPDDDVDRQPASQFLAREHRGLALRRRHAERQPLPQAVDVAVERVGLASCRLAALRARRRDEVLALGERVARAGRAQVARQPHRQLVLRHRHGPASVAVDERDRRAPCALARDREVARAIARGV